MWAVGLQVIPLKMCKRPASFFPCQRKQRLQLSEIGRDAERWTSHAQRSITPRVIAYRKRSRGIPAAAVLRMASHLRRSKMIPVMPNIRETGNENAISNPPRTANGLPHPPPNRGSVRIVRPPIPSISTESNPNRIFCLPVKIWFLPPLEAQGSMVSVQDRPCL